MWKLIKDHRWEILAVQACIWGVICLVGVMIAGDDLYRWEKNPDGTSSNHVRTECRYESIADLNPGRVLICEIARKRWASKAN